MQELLEFFESKYLNEIEILIDSKIVLETFEERYMRHSELFYLKIDTNDYLQLARQTF